MPRSYQGLTSYEDYEDMLVEKRDGGGVATLNVPEKLNALSPGIRYGLKRILEDMIDDDDAKLDQPHAYHEQTYHRRHQRRSIPRWVARCPRLRSTHRIRLGPLVSAFMRRAIMPDMGST